jgi:hypothetical protein
MAVGWRRWRRRRAMWSAIQEAAGNECSTWPWANKIHPINGLRAIRDFERINGIPFDPFDSYHRSKIRDAGRYRAGLSILRQYHATLNESRRVVAEGHSDIAELQRKLVGG